MVTAITPNAGSTAGGAWGTIKGNEFQPGATVTLDAMAVDDVEDLDWQKDPVLTIYLGDSIELKSLEFPEGVTLAHGEYVANMCIGCHREGLVGGKIPGGPPDWPPASRLAPGEGSVMGRYADADALITLFRSGKRPDGTAVQVMPFESLREMSETDLRALHLYLKALPGQG